MTSRTSRREERRVMTPEEIFALVREKLDEVGERFGESLGSDVAIVSAMGDYVSAGGGKMLRPALLLLAAGLVGYEGKQDVRFGTVFELIHTATLVHDDIIDEAATRRGRQSVNRRWGNHLTVLMGDHLYIKAMQLAIAGGDLRILDLLAETTLGMIEGEMIQRDQNGRLDITESEHLEVVRRKTALLFSACTRTPAMLAGAGVEQQRALQAFGLELGMAYQLVDDLLDFTGDEARLGKPTLNDLKEGKLTLPLVYLMRHGDPLHAERVKKVIEDGDFSRVSPGEILGPLMSHGCLSLGRATAVRYIDRARVSLSHFPDSEYREALDSVLDLVLDRDR
jgi:octaprenyl-diphosphate synthase